MKVKKKHTLVLKLNNKDVKKLCDIIITYVEDEFSESEEVDWVALNMLMDLFKAEPELYDIYYGRVDAVRKAAGVHI